MRLDWFQNPTVNKGLGAGLATIALAGVGAGIGIVFGSLIHSVYGPPFEWSRHLGEPSAWLWRAYSDRLFGAAPVCLRRSVPVRPGGPPFGSRSQHHLDALHLPVMTLLLSVGASYDDGGLDRPGSTKGLAGNRSHSIRGATEWVNSPTDSRLSVGCALLCRLNPNPRVAFHSLGLLPVCIPF